MHTLVVSLPAQETYELRICSCACVVTLRTVFLNQIQGTSNMLYVVLPGNATRCEPASPSQL